MTKRPAILSAVVILLSLPAAIFLQATLLANSLPGQVTPNLGLLLTVAAGYLWGAAGGATAGMWGGALLGAAVGSMAAPLACLYGAVGWLAGCHAERKPNRWTYPPAAFFLSVLALCGETLLSEYQPQLSWKLWSLGWAAAASLVFIGISRTEK